MGMDTRPGARVSVCTGRSRSPAWRRSSRRARAACRRACPRTPCRYSSESRMKATYSPSSQTIAANAPAPTTSANAPARESEAQEQLPEREREQPQFTKWLRSSHHSIVSYRSKTFRVTSTRNGDTKRMSSAYAWLRLAREPPAEWTRSAAMGYVASRPERLAFELLHPRERAEREQPDEQQLDPDVQPETGRRRSAEVAGSATPLTPSRCGARRPRTRPRLQSVSLAIQSASPRRSSSAVGTVSATRSVSSSPASLRIVFTRWMSS